MSTTSSEIATSSVYAWERAANETEVAHEAFDIYRQLGPSRSLAKVGERLGKSTTIIERWSSRHGWHARVLAWDRHEARLTNERVILGTASMRERQVVLSMQLASKAQQRLLRMTEQEINTMRPADIVALMKASADIERKAREIPDEELGAVAPDLIPHFEIRIISPGKDMVAVQMGDGRHGYIPRDQIERFKRDHPSAVVIA